jgi:ATP-dependent Clp protease adaptor protein ClpS
LRCHTVRTGRPAATDAKNTRSGRVKTVSKLQIAPVEVERPAGEEVAEPDLPWIVIVWNDPINLMAYVTWVFQKLFGYTHAKAEKLMMDVHTKGKAVVSSGRREKAESDVARLHAHGLWATMQKET